jgi:hypothetical protein
LGKQFLYSFFKVCASLKRQTFTTMMNRTVYVTALLLMVSVSLSNAQPAFEQRSLEEALNPDGTLKRGVQGSFKVEGYTMRTGKNGEPIFEPQTQHTASGTWDTQFGLPNGVSGIVRAVAADGQGNVYVGGSFTVVGGISTPVNNIARFNTQTNTWSTLGTGSSNGVNNWVYALAVVGNEVYVGGEFTFAGGVSANRVARFNTQTNTWSTLGTGSSNGVNSYVNALAVVGNEVVVGGWFNSAGGVSAYNVARFNTQTNTWSSLGTGSQNGVNNRVNALAVVGNEVFVGGYFTSAGGVSANYVARFNTQTNTWSTLGMFSSNGVNGEVSALAVVGNEVVVGGNFTSAGGVSANYVARFNTQTNTWSTLGTGSSNGVSGNYPYVYALAVVGNEVVVGGTFTSAGGVSANRVARFNTQTNTWSSLGTGSSNGVNSYVNALAVVGNEVVVGGWFTSAGGVSANYVARFNTQTNTWSSLGMFSSNGVNNRVSALAVLGNEVVVGGNFTSAGGVSANRVARFNTQTNTWSSLGTGSSNGVSGGVYPYDPYVTALAVLGNEVVVGGNFTSAGGVSANYVARFNTQTNTWSSLGTGSSNGVNNWVYALAVLGNEVVVGGTFTQAGGVSANYVARFNTQTNTWSTLGTGSSNGVSGGSSTVYALAVMGNEVVVGGDFTLAGGVSANFVARFNTQTNTWSRLGTGSSNGVGGIVRALAVVGNEVLVGGDFTSAGGVGANRVARFNTQTNTWSSLGTGSSNGVNYWVYALAVVGNEVVVGGRFTSAGGVSANYVARFNTQTNTWSSLGTGSSNGVNSTVNALAVVGNEVFVGGEFTLAGGIASTFIARYFPPTTNPSVTHTISADALYFFPPTGVSIFFTGVSGTGTCTVQRFDAPASNISFTGTPPTFTSQYRFVITASDFTFTSAELRFNRTQIPNAGITNAGTVRVYRRPTPSTGAFSILPNAFNSSFPDEVRATTTAFGEFILGSNDNSLPVELVAFTARNTAEGVQLTWRTASEQNNAGFEVQRRSEKASEWQVLGFVRGAGTTAEAQSYTFLDKSASGKVQYRLKQIDFDGQFEYSNVIEVDAGLPKVFALEQNYPNPFNPSTVMSYQLPVASNVSLKVYDVLGREVATLVNGRQEAGRYSVSFNAASFASGVYFYRLQAGNFVQTKKMMLVK